MNNTGTIGLNANTTNTQDYRTLLLARVTSKTVPVSGPFIGRPVYEWVEQRITDTAGDQDASGPRRGVYVPYSADPNQQQSSNLLLDPNNADIRIGSYVWARMKGTVTNGMTVYETVLPIGNVDSSPGSCSWLADIPNTTCLLLKMRGGSGRCACINVDNPNDLSGIVLVWNTDLGKWVGTVGYDSAGNITSSAMGTTCCGCGMARFGITSPSALTASLDFQGVHLSCGSGGSGGSPALVSITLVQEGCGTDPITGRRYVSFWGSGTDSCNGVQAPCDNTYHVRIECLPSCPPSSCACPACTAGNSPTPDAWYFGINGTSALSHDGQWVLVRAAGNPCGPWVATCKGVTWTLSVVLHAHTAPTWTLTDGEATFTVASIGCAAQTLFKTAGTGPVSVIVSPLVFPNASTLNCCGGCNWTYLKTKTLYLTIAGTGTTADGLVLSGVWDAGSSRFRLSVAWPDCGTTPIGSHYIHANFYCDVASIVEPFNIIPDGADLGYCNISADPFYGTSCSPFLASGTMTLGTNSIGGTVTGTFVISETPP